MRTWHDIAKEHHVPIQDVMAAARAVEKIEIPHSVIERDENGIGFSTVEYTRCWFVNSDSGAGYGHASDRLGRAYARGDTRWQAVENAIARGFRADRSNW
ncbi:hypothetical protein Uis1B_2212 [Bifidobacterium margollesii]|uniref:Uncharacterized protein n=1 Tax=Bifidobacterium margollesii TaxID=2020964 RepID=A0A2N5J6W8_9BIFI|nr:hypothetical protein [Bifidobacterium margollesii]PLS29944.1 hypothetical protein Uis1B_2212 [Bifidobacterium margollesii]